MKNLLTFTILIVFTILSVDCTSTAVIIGDKGTAIYPGKTKFMCVLGSDLLWGKWIKTPETVDGGQHINSIEFTNDGKTTINVNKRDSETTNEEGEYSIHADTLFINYSGVHKVIRFNYYSDLNKLELIPIIDSEDIDVSYIQISKYVFAKVEH